MLKSLLASFVGAVSLASSSASAATISLPPAIAGDVSPAQGPQRALTHSELSTISNWLELHRSGWSANLASPPLGTASISLDTAAQKSVLTLTLWPGPKHPGWNGAVLMENQTDKSIVIQTFSSDELAPVLGVLEARH